MCCTTTPRLPMRPDRTARRPHGRRVKAFVVLKEGEHLDRRGADRLVKDPAQGLTGYRAPKEVEFRDTLPETLVGKVLRRVCRTRSA